MNKSLKKDLKNLLFALVLGVCGFIGGIICGIVSTANHWSEDFTACYTDTLKAGILCAICFATVAILFPSSVKAIIRFCKKNEEE